MRLVPRDPVDPDDPEYQVWEAGSELHTALWRYLYLPNRRIEHEGRPERVAFVYVYEPGAREVSRYLVDELAYFLLHYVGHPPQLRFGNFINRELHPRVQRQMLRIDHIVAVALYAKNPATEALELYAIVVDQDSLPRGVAHVLWRDFPELGPIQRDTPTWQITHTARFGIREA